jgi:hypothetical protein
VRACAGTATAQRCVPHLSHASEGFGQGLSREADTVSSHPREAVGGEAVTASQCLLTRPTSERKGLRYSNTGGGVAQAAVSC